MEAGDDKRLIVHNAKKESVWKTAETRAANVGKHHGKQQGSFDDTRNLSIYLGLKGCA